MSDYEIYVNDDLKKICKTIKEAKRWMGKLAQMYTLQPIEIWKAHPRKDNPAFVGEREFIEGCIHHSIGWCTGYNWYINEKQKQEIMRDNAYLLERAKEVGAPYRE